MNTELEADLLALVRQAVALFGRIIDSARESMTPQPPAATLLPLPPTRPLLLSEAEVARQYGLKPAWLRKMRAKGQGPPWIKVGGLVRYHWPTLTVWFMDRMRGEVGPSK